MKSKSLYSDSGCLTAALGILLGMIGTIAFIFVCAIVGSTLEQANTGLRTSKVNSVREGIVTAKDRTEGYTYYKTSYVNKVPVTMPHIVPALYKMKITVEENGNKTEKTIDVSKEEYNSYKIGDTYKFK